MDTDNMIEDTEAWFTKRLNGNTGFFITRNNRLWESVAGFSQCGCVFCIYEDETDYCVHSGDEWNEDEEPNLGYYRKPLSYDQLIHEIAVSYVRIRQQRTQNSRSASTSIKN